MRNRLPNGRGLSLGVGQSSPPLYRCPVLPLWRGLVLSFPRSLRVDFAVSPRATHNECAVRTR
jgi:hypothetical protein